MTSSSPISTALTTASPFLLAVFGYITTAVHTLRTTQHEARVARVGAQLKGYAARCWRASLPPSRRTTRWCGSTRRPAAWWPGFRARRRPHFRDAVRADRTAPPPGVPHVGARRADAASERAMKTVIEHADLLESTTIEPLLLQLVAHVSAYRVILRRWEEGALAEGSHISYPDGVHAWASEQFRRLKRRQAELLGVDKDGRQGSFLMRLLVSRL